MRSIVLAGCAAATFLFLGSAETQAQAQTPARITTSEYVQQAVMSDLFEIDASKLAVEKADSKDVKAFAERMVKDHSASLKALTDAASRGQTGITPPNDLDGDHKARIALLRNASGVEFDKLYIDLQTGAHEFALTLHGAYARSGDNGELKTVAGDIARRVEDHLAQIETIGKATPQKTTPKS